VLATPALYGAEFDASNFLDSAVDKRALGEQLTPDPDVEAVGLVWAYLGSTLHIVGPTGEADVDANAYESIKGTLSVKQTHGREPSRNDEVAVGRDLMDQIGARIGDRITAGGANGPVELAIVGDNLDPGVDVAGHGFAMTVEGLSALGDASIQGTVVRFTPDADHAELVNRYSALGFAPVTPPSEVGHIGQLGGLPGRVAQVLVLLGLAALLNAMLVTVRSERREVALHRALGFTAAQVVGVHLWQSLVTACTGLVIGGSVGFVVGRAIDRQLVDNVGAIPETVLPVQVWVAGISTVVVCICAGVVTSALALREGPGRALRVE
jgi:predicted lysophospholipase L1 biosynthesis ABC-type transport system permease subunit